MFNICLYTLIFFSQFFLPFMASLRHVINAGEYIYETKIGELLFPSFAALMKLIFTSSEKFELVNFAITGKFLQGLFSLAQCALSVFLMITSWSTFSIFFFKFNLLILFLFDSNFTSFRYF